MSHSEHLDGNLTVRPHIDPVRYPGRRLAVAVEGYTVHDARVHPAFCIDRYAIDELARDRSIRRNIQASDTVGKTL